MSTIKVINVVHPSGSTNNIVNDASGNATIGNNLTVTGGLIPSSSFMRNRIINGAMVIDQRNAGASVTPATAQYLVDRWRYGASQASKFTAQQNAGSITPPVGFSNYLGLTVASAYSITSTDYFFVDQLIEGFNTADLAWGTANARPVTLSFQVYSSLTGNFGGSIRNGAANRSYPFTYTISSANTWTSISITIPGDTTGTWATNNTASIDLAFGLGCGSTLTGTSGAWASGNYVQPTSTVSVVGSAGATFYITGVQLEVGSVATPFERRMYGTELQLAQRYYWRQSSNGASFSRFGIGLGTSTAIGQIVIQNPVPMRDRPSVVETNALAVYDGVTVLTVNTVTTDVLNVLSSSINVNVGSGMTQFRPYELIGNNSTSAYVGLGAEL